MRASGSTPRAPIPVSAAMTRFISRAAEASSSTAERAQDSHWPTIASPPDARRAVRRADEDGTAARRRHRSGTHLPQSSHTAPGARAHATHIGSP